MSRDFRPDRGTISILDSIPRQPRTAGSHRRNPGGAAPQRIKVWEAVDLGRRSIAFISTCACSSSSAFRSAQCLVHDAFGRTEAAAVHRLALINDPEVVFLDELTTDSIQARRVWDLFVTYVLENGVPDHTSWKKLSASHALSSGRTHRRHRTPKALVTARGLTVDGLRQRPGCVVRSTPSRSCRSVTACPLRGRGEISHRRDSVPRGTPDPSNGVSKNRYADLEDVF